MLKRAAYERLVSWKKDPHHRALLVDGARQVGKTYLVRAFAQRHYGTTIEINFVESPEAKAIFAGNLDADTLIPQLSAFSGTALTPGDTLIFLDEIQECPRARTAIKFLVEDGRFDYIESGSLLGVTYENVPSLPVGYESELTLYPLSFEEFCWALGENETALEMARACFKEEAAAPAVIHQKLMELFKYYLIVGGMPAAVARFAQTRDIAQVQSVQKDILKLYRADIVKYARNKAHVGAIFDAIPAELSKKNKRFKLSDLAKSARMERYASDFMWVADAGVGLTCYNVKAPELPLSLNTQHNLFKLFLCDVGLLSAQTSGDARFDLLQGNLAVSWGSMLENAIAQELTAHGFDLRYFDKAKYGEVDFVIEKGSKALPIEAKSGKDYEKHKALDNVMAVREWGIDSAIVFCRGNVREEGKVLYLPWYAVMFIEKERGPQKIDLAEFLG